MARPKRTRLAASCGADGTTGRLRVEVDLNSQCSKVVVSGVWMWTPGRCNGGDDVCCGGARPRRERVMKDGRIEVV